MLDQSILASDSTHIALARRVVMKIIRSVIFGIFALSASSAVLANAGEPIDGPEQHCYGLAMVGYDSVINSRLGVPPEHVIGLASLQTVGAESSSFQPYLLKVVLGAYLWEKSPHNYAVKVMYNCSAQDAAVVASNTGTDDIM
jgi:hypothetical protein